MDAGHLQLRNETYRLFIENGGPPTAEEVASALGATAEDVRQGWSALHDAHALVLNGSRTDLLMVPPFSAVPTAHRVHAGGRWWYGNCAWDAFGVCAALGVDGRIESSCPDCGAPIEVGVVDREPDDDSLLFHCLVPAGQWWDDIVFT